MRRIAIVSLLLLLLAVALAACSAPSPAVTARPPEASQVKPEEWAARYPDEYADWKDSVHGKAYLAGNADAPGCTGCHGDPQTADIKTAAFRLEIPSRCARCHADGKVMAKYNVPADAYATYLADYHGTTIEYYRANDQTAWRYEAVCSDCHGSHAVRPPEDGRSLVAPANLVATCQKCHPGAGPKFASAYSGHLRTTAAGSLLVFGARLAYTILIPTVIGLMLAYIALDIVHRLRHRSGRKEA